jgi:hypothetical protein
MVGVIRKLVKLAIVLLIANALYQFVPPYMHYVQFKDAVREVALFSKDVPDDVLRDRLATLAEKYDVPIEPASIDITHQAAHIEIDASYVQVIQFMPGYSYPWQFDVRADAVRGFAAAR